MRHGLKVSAFLSAAALAALGCERHTTVVESPRRETVYSSGRTVDQTRVYDRDHVRHDDDDRDHGRYEDNHGGGYYRDGTYRRDDR
jgi:hypothetical protein